ncbi:dienelactone hydrolase [Pseudomonas duriflava]|uniref:Dienelactone hydrolase n=1 Tax=Pseudomonas duriflava TaxID=459528 RepID=A0A562QDX1_9PSED|nr:alpha/beta fold hydrolase [Pseudomonas duriflava]TWI54948.1 dienelactone hydrolase [Pseudomonas duriflava]
MLKLLLPLALYSLLGSNVAIAQTSTALTPDALPGNYLLLKQQMTYPDSWLSGHFKHFTKWRDHARQVVRDSLLTPDSKRAFNAEVIGRQQRSGYRAEKISFNLTDESRVAAFLLTPDTPGPHPAVLMLHDHGARFDIGKEKMIKPWGDQTVLASAQQWADKYFSGRFPGDELAKRGYVVLAVDALGWGERGPITYEQQQALASNFFNLGRSLAGTMAYEDIRQIDFLATLPQVDRHRIGVVGFSMGAFRAWQLAALSDKVAATAAISWFGTYHGLMTPGNNVLRGQSSFYMLHPGLPARLDIPDIASIAAPRPLLLFNGGQDTLFPRESVEDAYKKVHSVWRSQKAELNLTTRLWPELGHVFVQEQQDAAFTWFDTWLKPR